MAVKLKKKRKKYPKENKLWPKLCKLVLLTLHQDKVILNYFYKCLY